MEGQGKELVQDTPRKEVVESHFGFEPRTTFYTEPCSLKRAISPHCVLYILGTQGPEHWSYSAVDA